MLFALFLLEALSHTASACAATSTATTPTIPASCRTCDQNLIMITVAGGGAHAFQSDVTDLTGDCAVRTFTCVGNGANIEINNGDGVVNDIDDGAVDMTAILRVTCNAAATGWEFAGVVITQVECASGIV